MKQSNFPRDFSARVPAATKSFLAYLLLFVASFAVVLVMNYPSKGGSGKSLSQSIFSPLETESSFANTGPQEAIAGKSQPPVSVSTPQTMTVPKPFDPADLREPEPIPADPEFAAALREQQEEFFRAAAYTVQRERDAGARLLLARQLQERLHAGDPDGRLRQLLAQLSVDADPEVVATANQALSQPLSQ
jgi:hypothetical protein